MSESILLKKRPKIEFHILDTGFELVDGQTEQNSGFYSYNDLLSIELNKIWFPRVAKWLKIITWIFNGVPYFPDAETYKKSNIKINCREKKLGIWLTDPYMADKAKRIKGVLENKTKHNKRHT